MALNNTDIANLLFKSKQGKSSTNNSREFFEEPRDGRQIVFTNQIWTESGSIPTTAPTLADQATSGVVQYWEDLSLTAVPGTTNSFSSDNLKDAIPFNFGDGSYNYSLKSNTDAAIAFGQGDWIVDPETGTLTFYGTVPSNMPPKISFYKYVGAKGDGAGLGDLIETVDSTTTGASVSDFDPPSNKIVFTDGALSGIASIVAGISGEYLLLVNATGFDITIFNEDTGETAANRILTGSDADITFANGASLLLNYSEATERWGIVGGTGSGTGGGAAESPEDFVTGNDSSFEDMDDINWSTHQNLIPTYVNADTLEELLNFSSAHNYAIDQELTYTAGATGIGGLTTATNYFVKETVGTTAIKLSATRGGAIINITSSGSAGDQTFTPVSAGLGGALGTAGNITFTANTSTPLAGLSSGRLTKDAVNRQGEFLTLVNREIPLGYRGKPILLRMLYAASANYVAGDIKWYVGDITNNLVTEIFNQDDGELPAGSGIFEGLYYPRSNTAEVNIFARIETTNASAYTVDIDVFKFRWVPDIKLPGQIEQIINLAGIGSFTSGQIMVSKAGRQVTITPLTNLVHSSLSTITATNILPEWAEAPTGMTILNQYFVTGSAELRAQVAGRNLTFTYASARTDTGSPGLFTITYNAKDAANTTDALAINGGLKTEKSTQSDSTMSTSGNYLIGASYTLRAGRKYEVKGVIGYGNNGSNPAYTSLGSRWCSANGANNSTPPSLLLNNLNSNIVYGLIGDNKEVDVNNSFGTLDAPSFIIDVKNDITIFLVPRALASSPANARVASEVTVQEIPFSQTALIQQNKSATLKDAKASGTDGGSASAATTQDRALSELVDPFNLVNLSSSLITFNKPGTYLIEASAPAYRVERHKLLFTDSSNTVLFVGSSAYSSATSFYATTESTLKGVLSVTDTTTQYKLRHYTEGAQATVGLGLSTSLGGIEEIYAQMTITKQQ